MTIKLPANIEASIHTDLDVNTSKDSNRVYSAAQVQAMDDYAVNKCKHDGFELMQSAGLKALQYIQTIMPKINALLIFCGPGNNGGDGWILAGLAAAQGFDVLVLSPNTCAPNTIKAQKLAMKLLPAKAWITDNWLQNSSFQAFNNKWASEAHQALMVDALFGIGLNKPLEPTYASLVSLINLSAFSVLSLDAPSGINCTTGQGMNCFVKANMTLSFIANKRGLFRDCGRVASGQLHLETLQLENTAVQAIAQQSARTIFQDAFDRSVFQSRAEQGHKGSFGTVLCVGGDEGMGGAIIIAAESALSFGAGKVILGSSRHHTSIAITRCPSIMTKVLDTDQHIMDHITQTLSQANCLVLGPGLGQSPWSLACFTACLTSDNFQGAAVLDADALNLIAHNDQAYSLFMANRRQPNAMPIVITPHLKEAQRLAKRTNKPDEIDPFELAFLLSQHYQSICLLKGHGTLIADNDQAYICSTGNSSLAKAGQGDCLSGMIGALIAQGTPAFMAARQAAWAHGLAADVWCQNESPLSLMPHETATIAARAMSSFLS